MKIFITGANGLLGQHLIQIILDYGHSVIATGKGQSRLLIAENPRYKYYPVDITEDFGLHDAMFTEKPDIVVHTAAMTQVDECELKQDECFAVNVTGTTRAISCAELYSHYFIYVSTDFVFDGEKGNYAEGDVTAPVNWYGFTKLTSEQIVGNSQIPWAIVRTCLVYGNTVHGTRSNIIAWVKDKLKKGEKIQVVDDQVRTPTYVEDLARGILLIIENKAKGIFHISGKDVLTPYAMALQTADFFGLNKALIGKADASTFRQPAKRPPKTGFIIDKARKELGYHPLSFAEGLKKMFSDGN